MQLCLREVERRSFPTQVKGYWSSIDVREGAPKRLSIEAETTLEAWKRGDVPPIETDGIGTAEDISTIDLKDTWLVTLSACDTGYGEARAGEGVLGLRRGFIEAGAQNLLRPFLKNLKK